jgi:dihydroxyacid dehydratase/phosphogluconate dehydratase
MYTANTMASAAEALGMTLPGSSSYPAEYPEKQQECESVGKAMMNLLEQNILPREIMTRSAFENAMVSVPSRDATGTDAFQFYHFKKVLTMALGGSTNAVLHLIAIAHSVGIKLTIDDFQAVSDRVPFLADLKPSGKYVMEDVHKIGGIPGASNCALYSSGDSFGFCEFHSCTLLSYGTQADRWKQYNSHREDSGRKPRTLDCGKRKAPARAESPAPVV